MAADPLVRLPAALAAELAEFALAQGLQLPDDVSAERRVVRSIEFVLGVAEGAAGHADEHVLAIALLTCESCGCTDDRACIRPHPGGVYEHRSGQRYDVCRWVRPGLCSACGTGADPGWVHPADQQELAAA